MGKKDQWKIISVRKNFNVRYGNEQNLFASCCCSGLSYDRKIDTYNCEKTEFLVDISEKG